MTDQITVFATGIGTGRRAGSSRLTARTSPRLANAQPFRADLGLGSAPSDICLDDDERGASNGRVMTTRVQVPARR